MPKFALALTLAAGLSTQALLPAAAGDGANFDGNWTVQLVTESGGLCESSYSYSLTVQDGQIRPVSKAASNGATVSGRVGTDGSVGLNVSTSSANGSASGRLQARGGSGTWKVASFCSGRWTARRSTTRTAQAD